LIIAIGRSRYRTGQWGRSAKQEGEKGEGKDKKWTEDQTCGKNIQNIQYPREGEKQRDRGNERHAHLTREMQSEVGKEDRSGTPGLPTGNMKRTIQKVNVVGKKNARSTEKGGGGNRVKKCTEKNIGKGARF